MRKVLLVHSRCPGIGLAAPIRVLQNIFAIQLVVREALGQLTEYLAARKMRRALGLPDRVFAKIGTETKPVYVDLTSPRYVSSFCTILRSTRQTAGEDVGIVFTEMLPTPDQAWVPDASGQRYYSELRIQLVDPLPARDTGGT